MICPRKDERCVCRPADEGPRAEAVRDEGVAEFGGGKSVDWWRWGGRDEAMRENVKG